MHNIARTLHETAAQTYANEQAVYYLMPDIIKYEESPFIS